MNNVKKLILMMVLVVINMAANAQDSLQKKATVGVFSIDQIGLGYNNTLLGNLLRVELSKLDKFQILDRYEMLDVIKKNNFDWDSCYGKTCLTEFGKVLHADKMLSGSIERYNKVIIISLWLIDVKTGTIEKTVVNEYIDLPHEIQNMFSISLHKMFALPISETLTIALENKSVLDNQINHPYQSRLKLNGPRMGFIHITGDLANVIKSSENEGGIAAAPTFFQFGYQFETQYLNTGKYQALFEFVPNISGLDQGKFFPSFNMLNGLRNNISGWEIALGPSITFTPQAEGFYNSQNQWVRKADWDSTGNPTFQTRVDFRGKVKVSSTLIIAAGKTFRSGKLNVPVNLFYIPGNREQRFGISFGYNAIKD